MNHYVYQILDPITEQFYFGVRSCKCLPKKDPYMGSMSVWEPENPLRLKKIILCEFDSRKKANQCEKKIIDRHIRHPLNENYHNTEKWCNYGKSHSEETKKKISKSEKGKVVSIETRKKQSEARKGVEPWNKGKKCPKISRALSGRKLSKESRKKMSDSHKGKKLSKEHRRKIGLTSIGRVMPEGAKQKIRESKLGKNNPMFGKTGEDHHFYGKSHSKKTREAISKKVKKYIKENGPVNSKLHEEDVMQIRSIYDQGWFTQKEISESYDVSVSAIKAITQRRTWKYV